MMGMGSSKVSKKLGQEEMPCGEAAGWGQSEA